ncbi:lysozyme inhibitor LprI family protein [Paenibacillus tuaregi]|uniref:lysozyme inhibitor LprI family protein n=1 Tax=Paenibacillus tuaregi TaxID=1816681 RepID=UPI0008391F07|nr:lysozyme inhibitor LprI family protein [Paenibacillus tuaregi]
MKKTLILALLTLTVLSGCGSGSTEGASQGSQINSSNSTNQANPTSSTNSTNSTNYADQTNPSNQTGDADHTGSILVEAVNQPGRDIRHEVVSAVSKPKSVIKTKQKYLKKLDAVEKGMADLEKMFDEGSTASMREASSEMFKRWDQALNEVYGALKQQLSKKDMAKLKTEQRRWIKQRDEEAEKAGKEFEGGTLEPVIFTATQAEMTKKRCYELVKTYMK